MKFIKKGTIKEFKGSSKVTALGSIILTGAIALAASGCTTEVKAEGITIDKLEISGSDAQGILEGANVVVNADVDTQASVPAQSTPDSAPSFVDIEITDPSDKAPETTNTPNKQEPANTEASQPADNSNTPAKKDLYQSFLCGEIGAGRKSFGTFYEGNNTVASLVDDFENDPDVSSINRNTCASYSYIDCGNDGIPELLLVIKYQRAFADYQTYYIIKEFNDKLYICYTAESWYRNLETISSLGEITCDTSGGAYHHYYTKGFVDGNGDFQLLYQCEITRLNGNYDHVVGCYDYFDESNDLAYIEYYTDGLDVDYTDWSIIAFRFDDKPNPSTSSYFTYCVWDGNGKDTTTEANFSDSDRIVGIMNYYGLKVYDHAQIEEMVFARAEELGALNIVSTDLDYILCNK